MPLRALAAAILVLLLAGHVAVWYWPRSHAAPLDATTPAGELLLEAPGARVWVPFPHQSALVRSLLELGSGANGEGALQLPRFGPFRLPPSREFALARSDRSTELIVQVYPIWAAVGRVAGRLTGNRWLRPGSFKRGGESVSVAWQGNTWSVTLGEPRSATRGGLQAAVGSGSRTSRFYAAFALDETGARGLVSAFLRSDQEGERGAIWALSRVDHDEAELVRVRGALLSATSSAVTSRDASTSVAATHTETPAAVATASIDACAAEELGEVAACWWESVPGDAHSGDAGGERAVLLVASAAPHDPHVLRLPSAATLVRGRGASAPPQRTDLPAERLARRLDASFFTGEGHGWQIVALDDTALETARALAQRWAEPVEVSETAPSLALFVAPRRLLRVTRGVSDALENLPLTGVDEVESWRLGTIALERLESLDTVTVLATTDRALARWTRSAGAHPER